MFRSAAIASVLLAGAGLAGCESTNAYNYAPYEAGQAVPLEPATIVNVRPVRIGGRDSGAGTVGGALVGGASGAAIGGDAAGGLIGAVAGAVIGNAVERGATRQTGFAYDVRMQRSGRVLEVVQPDPQPIPVGSQVYVSFGPQARIIPAGPPGAPPPPPPPPRY
jgi:outer membrane lipoprotein SlyB